MYTRARQPLNHHPNYTPHPVIHLTVLKDVTLPAAAVSVVDAVPVPDEPESVDVRTALFLCYIYVCVLALCLLHIYIHIYMYIYINIRVCVYLGLYIPCVSLPSSYPFTYTTLTAGGQGQRHGALRLHRGYVLHTSMYCIIYYIHYLYTMINMLEGRLYYKLTHHTTPPRIPPTSHRPPREILGQRVPPHHRPKPHYPLHQPEQGPARQQRRPPLVPQDPLPLRYDPEGPGPPALGAHHPGHGGRCPTEEGHAPSDGGEGDGGGGGWWGADDGADGGVDAFP